MTTELALLVAGAAAGGFVQGISGFAFGLTALSFWAWGIEPGLATVMAVFGGLAGQLFSTATLRRRPPPATLLPLLAGALFGIPLGVLLLADLDAALFKGLLGALLLVCCPALLLAGRLPTIAAGGRLADAAAGAVGGLLCGVGGVPGIASALWCLLRGYDKDLARAVVQHFNLAALAATFVALIAAGRVTREMLPLFPAVALALLLPSALGARLHAGLGQAAFRRIVLVLLTASGAAMLVAALPHGGAHP